MARRILTVTALTAVATLTLAACAGAPPAAQKGSGASTDPISFRLNWTWGSEFTPYVVADELGYFQDEGLNVEVLEGEGSAVTATLLGNGAADIGTLAAGEALVAVSRGLPVQAIATTVPNTPTAVIYNTEKLDFRQLTDLYGHKVGVMNESATYKEWQAVTSLNDVDVSKMEEVAVGQAGVQAILTGKVDALIGLSFNQGLQARTKGAPVKFVQFSELGLNIPQESLAVNTDFAKKHPKDIEAFLRAVTRGWKYTVENPDAALALVLKTHPEIDKEFNTQKLPLVLELLDDDVSSIGTFDKTRWENLHKIYDSQGLLPKPVKLEGQVYTTEYLNK